jgi:hypothetical protein
MTDSPWARLQRRQLHGLLRPRCVPSPAVASTAGDFIPAGIKSTAQTACELHEGQTRDLVIGVKRRALAQASSAAARCSASPRARAWRGRTSSASGSVRLAPALDQLIRPVVITMRVSLEIQPPSSLAIASQTHDRLTLQRAPHSQRTFPTDAPAPPAIRRSSRARTGRSKTPRAVAAAPAGARNR